MVKLLCALIGAGGSMFSVKIDASDLVDDLKKAIKAEKVNALKNVDADQLSLFLAKKNEGRGAWLTETEVKHGVKDISGLFLLEHVGAPLSVIGFTEEAVRFRLTKEDVAAGNIPVHVLVKVPEPIVCAASLTTNVQLPTAIALNKPEQFAEECISLDDWEVNAVHRIPSIWKFMSSLGGCTQTGKIFWRMEDKQIMSLLLDGWLHESSWLADKKSIVLGSPGIGKSTLLCADCLVYLGYDDGKVVQFAVDECEDQNAIDIYKKLVRQQGISNVWLLLDGFRYQDIPVSLTTFTMLATSQQVDLKSEDQLIVKLKSTSGKKGNVAYLQFTVAAQHGIDSNQLKEMNKIFYPDDVKEAGNTEPPIYIAVCPDLESCKALRLNPAPQVVAAKQVCQVFVGYYAENKYGIAADGPTNDKIVKSLLPHTHNLRKRQRLEE
ncbi:unnamed protein product [Peronospora farinosa]|uniref:Crinkler effector protein N-terminal domain-containing protein n=1 Tax=Peronospora farinosa TaxID=134698 RepID=A0AAV0T3M8_9STRA|nr:unnamed protein product [Peronospora farinosa]